MSELRQFRGATNGTTMRFVGPVLVRTMPRYQVLSLPSACSLYTGGSLGTEIPGFLADWRKRAPEETWWMSGRFETEPERALQAVVAAKHDPVAVVRETARELERVLRAKAYREGGGEAEPSDK